MRAIILALFLGCHPQKAPEASVVQGTVRLNGAAPKTKPFRIACPTCAPRYPGGMPREDLVVDKENRIQGAFVYVKKGLEGKTFEAPKTPVVLDQKGCRYEPRVLGIMPGQELLIRNSDPHAHCVHILPFANREHAFHQEKSGSEDRRKFENPEIMIKVKDDIMPWMAAWIGVVEHPFFAVTAPDGAYSIKGLPPGKYTLQVWQERCRFVSAEVEVRGTEIQTADFKLELKPE